MKEKNLEHGDDLATFSMESSYNLIQVRQVLGCVFPGCDDPHGCVRLSSSTAVQLSKSKNLCCIGASRAAVHEVSTKLVKVSAPFLAKRNTQSHNLSH